MRLQTFYLIKLLSMGETNFTTVKEMMPFEWDDEEEEKETLVLNEDDWVGLEKKYTNKWQSN